jgi:subtilisin family serine protease
MHVIAHGSPHTPNDPRFPGQWYFANLEMQDAWGITLGDPNTTIVVIDSGCDLQHPDLVAKLDPGIDVVSGDNDPSYDLANSGAAHGTACAGLAGASTDNSEGIAGACPECRLRCVRMLSDSPIPVSAEIEAFQFALDVGAAVISNSWGYKYPTPVPTTLADAIQNVFQNGRGGKGAMVLFSAGNDDRVIADDELQAAAGVLCIGAINNFDDHTSFTNSGNAIDLVAPTGTLTADISGSAGDDPGDYMSLFGGTSSACPVAAGIAGLLVSAAPDRTSAELYDVLIQTARPAPYAVPDAMGHDQVFGYGIVDPVSALQELLGIPDAGAGGSGGAGITPEPHATNDDAACGCSVPGGAAEQGMTALPYAAMMVLARVRRRRARR